jgi:hypothetical protein
MRRHYYTINNVYMSWTACGLHRCVLDPKHETKRRNLVTCKNCKKILKARGK